MSYGDEPVSWGGIFSGVDEALPREASPLKLYVRVYYLVRVLSAEVEGSLRLLEKRYWDLLFRFYSEEMGGRRVEAQRVRKDLEAVRSLAGDYLYVKALLSILGEAMEDTAPEDLSAPWPLFGLARNLIHEALRYSRRVSAVLAVQLGEIGDALDAILAGQAQRGIPPHAEDTVIAEARSLSESELDKRMPRPFVLAEDVRSLA